MAATDPQAAADEIRGWLDAHPDAELFEFPRAWLAALLAERDQLAAELKQVRGESAADTGAVAKALIALHDVKLPLLVGLAVAELEDTFLSRLAQHVAPEAFARFEAEFAKRGDTAETTATRPADGPDGTGEGQRTGTGAREAQRGSQGDGAAEAPQAPASPTSGNCPWCGTTQRIDDGFVVAHRRFSGHICPGSGRRASRSPAEPTP